MAQVPTTLEVIPEPAPRTRTVLKTTSEGPVIKSSGSRDYACGQCGEILLESVAPGQVSNMVVCCPNCGAYNEVP